MTSSNIKMVIAARKDLNMRKGKLAAQVAHAVTLYYESLTNQESSSLYKLHKKWINTGYTKIVVSVDTEDELLFLICRARDNMVHYFSVYDFGLTEFHGQRTLTCCGFGPDISSNLEFTKNLKLL